MGEVIANSPTPGVSAQLTTLGAAITSTSATSITASAAATGNLLNGNFRIIIDTEIMLVTTGQSGTTWTVTRGVEGSTAATHLINAPIYHVWTQAGLATVFAATFFQTPTVGGYLTSQFCGSYYNNAGPANLGDMYACPVMIPATHTYVGIAIKVWDPGSAGSVCRMGIYSDNGSGSPGALLLDAGTVATTNNVTVQVTISQQLAAGTLVWLVCVPQVAMPTFVALFGSQSNNNQSAVTGPLLNPGLVSALGVSGSWWLVSGVTSTLPSTPTWGLDSSSATRIPNVALVA